MAALRLARAGRLGAAVWRVVERVLGAEAATARVWKGAWELDSLDERPWLRDLAARVGEADLDPREAAGEAALSWWLRAYLATRPGVGDRPRRDGLWTALASRLRDGRPSVPEPLHRRGV